MGDERARLVQPRELSFLFLARDALERQELECFRYVDHRRHEPRVNNIHSAVFAGLIARGQFRRDLLRDLEGRTLADAEIFLYDMIAPVAEILLGLASDDDKIGFFLVGNMPHRFLEYVRGIGAG